MKYIKRLLVLVVACLFVITLAGCDSQRGIYNEYKGAGSSLPLNHVYEVISSSDLMEKIDEGGEKFYVLYGSSSDSLSTLHIAEYNHLAKQYGVNKIYLLRREKVVDSKQYDELKDDYNLKVSYTINFWTFKDGEVVAKLDKYIDSTGARLEKYQDIENVFQQTFLDGFRS